MTQQELFQEQILASVEDIEEAKFEAEMAVMLKLADYYEKADLLLEQYEGDDLGVFTLFTEQEMDEGFVQEGVKSGLKKLGKNVVYQLRRVLALIARVILAIINFFKKLFGKKEKKTADQVMLECGVNPSSNEAFGTDERAAEEFVRAFFVSIAQADAIVLKPKAIVDEATGLLGKSKRLKMQGKLLENTDIHSLPVARDGSMALNLVLIPDAMGYLKELIQNFLNIKDPSGTFDSKTFHKQITLLNKLVLQPIDKEVTITMADLTRTQTQFNEIFSLLDKSVDTMVHGEITEEYKGVYQKIALICNLIVKNFTAVHALLKNCFYIDEKYTNSISDPVKLDEVAALMVGSGIGAKYIMYNVAKMTSPELNQNEEPNKQWSGQTRLVINPKEGPIVYKVAINQSGIHSNQLEKEITLRFQEVGIEKMLARTLDIQKHKAVTTVERAPSTPNVVIKNLEHLAVMNGMEHKIEKLRKEGKLNFVFKGVHANNIGKIGKRIVIIDYGKIQ